MTVGDASPVWHPFTQHALQPSSIEIVAAEGAWLTTGDGRLILDAISSWWVTTHGHRHPHIVEAIKAEADRLDQVIFAGFTHAPAERLARGLVAIAPPGLDTCLLFRQRLDLGRGRTQDGARLLAQHGRVASPCPRARARLSRRHDRRHVGRRARCVQRAVRAAAVRGDAAAVSGRWPRAADA